MHGDRGAEVSLEWQAKVVLKRAFRSALGPNVLAIDANWRVGHEFLRRE